MSRPRLPSLPSVSQRKRFLRRSLGLPAEAPDPRSRAGSRVRTRFPHRMMVRVEPGELARRRAAWHAEDRRADIANALARVPQQLTSARYDISGRFHGMRSTRALARARELRYRSNYAHPTEGCSDIEGYFDFGGERAFGLQIVAAGALKAYAESEWQRGQVLDGESNVLAIGRHLILPVDQLDELIVREAIERWYRDRFAYARGHWTHLEGRQPEIVLDLAWFEGVSTDDPRLQLIRADLGE